MTQLEVAVDIRAPHSRVWGVLVDVERWAEWTPTVTSVARQDEGPLRVGSRTRVVQPKLKPAIWKVTELDESRGVFVWVSRSSGIVVTAGHFLEEIPIGTRAKLTVDFSGLLVPLIRMLIGKATQHYVETEVRGLKQHCESL
jgi:carbon monoxide dehydrogenase subunit G